MATVSRMGVVDINAFHRAMSSPPWNDERKQAASELLGRLESALADALMGTIITPEPFAETVPTSARTGQLLTSYPVYRPLRIDGVEIDEAEQNPALPAGWRHFRKRLFAHTNATAVPGASVLGTRLATDSLLGMGSGPFAAPAPAYGDRRVHVEYLAGWGDEPALVQAIIGKAKKIMDNDHSDSITTRDTGGNAPSREPEEWTPAELAPLGRFRGLAL